MVNYQRADLNLMNFIFNVNENQTIKKFIFGYKRRYTFLYIFQHHASTQHMQAPIPGLKRKLKTYTIETKFQAIVDIERGIGSKAAISKSTRSLPTPCQRG